MKHLMNKGDGSDPSPTAEATRLMLPPRTSPTAKTPGRLVSRRYGARVSGDCAAAKPSGDSAGHHEHVSDVVGFHFSSLVVRPANAIQMVVPLQSYDLGPKAYVDRRVLF